TVRLLVVPHWVSIEPEVAERLRRYVEEGGVLLVGARTGTRDAQNQVVSQTPPGLLSELFGVTVEEYGKVTSHPDRILLEEGGSIPLQSWYEVLEAHGADVVGTWECEHYHGLPALTMRRLGKGRAYYRGTYLNEEVFAGLLDRLAGDAGLHPLIEGLPEAVEAVERTDGQRSLLFLLNHGGEVITVPGVPNGLDLLTDTPVRGSEISLEPFGVAILRVGA
ncbi:MAG TPA: beta-galactosidase trimerization domain-containing protein, partial [Armatimonadota bacterium]|nr:beta-galactosidase trimerization domain-containing protein [Armatimonadota bacterium]